MKKIAFVFALITTVFAVCAAAAQSPIAAQNFPAFDNKLVNPGFENGSYGWTASGGATKTANSTAKLNGSYGYDWDSNAAAQTLISNSVTVTNGLSGKNGVAFCSIKAASGTATHTITVDDGTNNLVTPQTITSSTSSAPVQSVNFIFPSGGSVRLKLASVASNEPEIYIDDCYLGLASNLSNVSQASFYGSLLFPGNASCDWQNASVAGSTWTDVPVNANCVIPTGGQIVGSVAVPATKQPQVVLNNHGPGTYRLEARGNFLATGTNGCLYRFTDGTNSTAGQNIGGLTNDASPVVTGEITYTSGGTHTIKLQASGSSGTNTCDIFARTSGFEDFQISVYKFPSDSQTAYTANATAMSWSGYTVMSGASQWNTTSASYVDPTPSGTSTLTDRVNNNFGTVSQAASNLPGITFTPKKTGPYFVCATVAGDDNVAGSTAYFKLTDGTTDITFAQSGSFENRGIYSNIPMCGVYNVASVSPVTLKIQAAANAGSTASIFAQDPAKTNPIEWSIIAIGQNFPAPILVGSVTSNSSGGERTERARIANGGSASITSQSGSWLSSVTRNGAGDVTFNIAAGMFSAAPTCSCLPVVSSTSIRDCSVITTTTPSASAIRFMIVNSSNTATDTDFMAICNGPR